MEEIPDLRKEMTFKYLSEVLIVRRYSIETVLKFSCATKSEIAPFLDMQPKPQKLRT